MVCFSGFPGLWKSQNQHKRLQQRGQEKAGEGHVGTKILCTSTGDAGEFASKTPSPPVCQGRRDGVLPPLGAPVAPVAPVARPAQHWVLRFGSDHPTGCGIAFAGKSEEDQISEWRHDLSRSDLASAQGPGLGC